MQCSIELIQVQGVVKVGDKLPRSRLLETTFFLNSNYLKPGNNALFRFVHLVSCRASVGCSVHLKQIFVKRDRVKGRRQGRRDEENLYISSPLYCLNSLISTT